MAVTDWDEVAKQEFESMDREAQAQWKELRDRVNNRAFTPYI